MGKRLSYVHRPKTRKTLLQLCLNWMGTCKYLDPSSTRSSKPIPGQYRYSLPSFFFYFVFFIRMDRTLPKSENKMSHRKNTKSPSLKRFLCCNHEEKSFLIHLPYSMFASPKFLQFSLFLNYFPEYLYKRI